MNGEREIFSDALELRAGSARASFLARACAGRAEMRARLEALLRAADDAGDFLAEAPAGGPESADVRIGRYQLRERIGEGGFGVVYRADQDEPVRRTVALKVIKLGMDTRAVVTRFEAERQALALMEHPHIARVFDGGATETGRPYFVMELVPGVPLTTFADEQGLPVCERLELFLQVCRAVHHAHQKGVIHRDLKPSNILVAREGDRPMAKVIDFGIAKATRDPLTEKTLWTRRHLFMGTPAYMSPEQAGLDGLDVDTRSDIYSLGALLYELVSGVPILDGRALLAAGYAEVQRAISFVEPPAPSARVAGGAKEIQRRTAERRGTSPARLVAELRGDLDRIILKCLEKDRTRRYETTEDLARDLGRYLRNEPVLARPATLGYRAAKFVLRHREGVGLAAAALVMLATFAVFHTRRLATERDRARSEAEKVGRASEVLTGLLAAADPFSNRGSADPAATAMLESAAARVRREFANQPELRAEIFNVIGRAYLRLGQHEPARAILGEALAAGRTLAKPDLRLAQTLSDLGVLRRERGDFAGAIEALEEALRWRRQHLGGDHNDIAITLVELARTYSALGRVDRAEPLSVEALAMRQRVLGPEHREIATSLGDLGAVQREKGDLAQAEKYFQQSMAMHRRTVGPEHPNYAQAMANFALVRIDQNDLGAAEELLRDALALLRKSLGPKHWRTARVLSNLGRVWCGQGRHAEAAAALEEAQELARTALGADNLLVAGIKYERARVHLALGEEAAAEALLRAAMRAQLAVLGPGADRVRATQALLFSTRQRLGKNSGGQELRLEAEPVPRARSGETGRGEDGLLAESTRWKPPTPSPGR